MPLLLAGFRDEFTGRPWQPPARHWPGSPLVGGRDQEAGGTWLAVHPAVGRVSCILNARGRQAALSRRRSRGELPLRAAAEGPQALRELQENPGDLVSYDPFFLLRADLASVRMLGWDGRRATLEGLEAATHVITNAGHMYPPRARQGPKQAPPGPQPPPGPQTLFNPQPPFNPQSLSNSQTPPDSQALAGSQEPPDPWAKADHFGPKFAAHRPPGDPAATIKDAWGEWLTLADGDGLSDTDAAAIVVRRNLPDGRVWGTTSVSLVALGRDGLRYDFQPVPGDATTWYAVDLDRHETGDSLFGSAGPARDDRPARRPGIPITHTNPISPASIIDREDPGLWEDPGDHRAPNPPRDPNPPRNPGPGHTMMRSATARHTHHRARRRGPAPSSEAAQKNSKYSRISQSLTSWPGGPSEAGSEASASEYRPISARFIITR